MTSPPGWYPDPDNAGHARWWDGTDWASPPAPQPSAIAPQPVEEATSPELPPVDESTSPEGGSWRRPLLISVLVVGLAVALFALLGRGSGSSEIELGVPTGVTIEEIYQPGPDDGDVVGISGDGRGVVTRLDDRLCRRFLDDLGAEPDCVESEEAEWVAIGVGASVWPTAGAPLLFNRAQFFRDPSVIDFDAGTVVDIGLDDGDGPSYVIPLDVVGDRLLAAVDSDIYITDLDGTDRQFVDRLGADDLSVSGRLRESAVMYSRRDRRDGTAAIIQSLGGKVSELPVDFSSVVLLDVDLSGSRGLIIDLDAARWLETDVLHVADFGSEAVRQVRLTGIASNMLVLNGWLSASGNVAWVAASDPESREVSLLSIELDEVGAIQGRWTELTRWGKDDGSIVSFYGRGLGQDGQNVVYRGDDGAVYRLVPSYG